MKHRLLLIIIALFASSSLVMTTSCTSKPRQLTAAIEAINKEYPMQIAEGTTLEGFFLNEGNVDIAVTLDDASILREITPEGLNEMHEGFIFYFASVVREDHNMKAFFQLLEETQTTLSVTITTVPSHHRHRINITANDIQQITSVNNALKQ